MRYCEWLTENSPGHAYKYRLPTQEEWELAAGHMPKDASINAANVETAPTDVYYYYGLYGSGAYNKGRQQKITAEILDLVGGAQQ